MVRDYLTYESQSAVAKSATRISAKYPECRPRVEANPPRARASGLPPERIARATGAWKRDSQSAGTDAPEDASVGPSHGWKNIGC